LRTTEQIVVRSAAHDYAAFNCGKASLDRRVGGQIR
jgi:hypothetical protein